MWLERGRIWVKFDNRDDASVAGAAQDAIEVGKVCLATVVGDVSRNNLRVDIKYRHPVRTASRRVPAIILVRFGDC